MPHRSEICGRPVSTKLSCSRSSSKMQDGATSMDLVLQTVIVAAVRNIMKHLFLLQN